MIELSREQSLIGTYCAYYVKGKVEHYGSLLAASKECVSFRDRSFLREEGAMLFPVRNEAACGIECKGCDEPRAVPEENSTTGYKDTHGEECVSASQLGKPHAS
jgi:hypothetical protein